MKKEEIRKVFLEKRANLPSDNHRMTARLGNLLIANPEIKLLHAFISDPARNEVDTQYLHELLGRTLSAIQWAAPRIIPGTKEMEHFLWNAKTELLPNRQGILEPNPDTSQRVEIQDIDAILIPLLAFDLYGNRVGYGGGYYDRFLAKCPPDAPKIGLSFFEPIEKIEDANRQDVKLDICVTPSQIYYWNNSL